MSDDNDERVVHLEIRFTFFLFALFSIYTQM